MPEVSRIVGLGWAAEESLLDWGTFEFLSHSRWVTRLTGPLTNWCYLLSFRSRSPWLFYLKFYHLQPLWKIKIKNRAVICSINSTSVFNPKKTNSLIRKAMFTRFIAALPVITRLWKQPRCPSMKTWWIYIMEYYAATKNEILPLVTTWMHLEGIS